MQPRPRTPTPVGRARELAAIDALLAPGAGGPRTLVLDGDAGIGKTTLLTSAVLRARRAGLPALHASPAEAERELPWSALGDLFDAAGVLGEAATPVLDALPAPQRAAIAWVRGEAGDAVPDPVHVARATLGVLRAASAAGALLVVDDLHWLDPASSDALSFALRRLGDAPLAVLLARRTRVPLPPPMALERVAGMDVRCLVVGPLDAMALDELLRERGIVLSRPALLALHARAAGNPLHALELARLGDGDDAAVDEGAAAAERARVRALAMPVRQALLAVALAAHPTHELVAAATGSDPDGAGGSGLAAALDAALLVESAGRLRLAHPLLGSAAIDEAGDRQVRAMHASLAAAMRTTGATGPAGAGAAVQAAVHLARAVDPSAPVGPGDADLAARLEAAAGDAARSGAPALAAELAGVAADRTPADDVAARLRRRLAEADGLMAAGDPARGRLLLESLAASTTPGHERAGILWRLADAVGDDIDASIRLSEQALAEAGDDDALCAEIHTALATFTWLAGDLARSAGHCRFAASHARAAGDERALAIALADACHADVVAGRPLDRALMDEALALEPGLDGVAAWLRPSYQLGVCHLYLDELDAARPLLEQGLERVRGAGDEGGRLGVLFRLAELELRAGRWDRAVAWAREARLLARQAGIEQEQSVCLAIDALVAAHVGRVEDAVEAASEAWRIADEAGDAVMRTRAAAALGFAALSTGDTAEALRWLTPAVEGSRAMGNGEMASWQVVHNELDALVADGRAAEALDRIAWIEEAGRPTGRAWHRVIAGRSRAALAAAAGDADEARARIEETLAILPQLPQPFERARTLFVLGAAERRLRGWAAARGHLSAALDGFDALGAARWAERAAAELGRLPGRRPAGPGPSRTELEVARLAADGLSNKEIAARLFVSVRTVEAHLSSAYEKLGVGSRAALAAKLRDIGNGAGNDAGA